jgi:hypothetical protein
LSIPKLVGDRYTTRHMWNKNHGKFEIFAIDNMLDDDWRKPIVEYLENITGDVAWKIKYRALNYVIIGIELFKKTVEWVLLKCLNETEAYIAISDVHSGVCGSHQTTHKMKWFLFRQGMYWPSMLKIA